MGPFQRIVLALLIKVFVSCSRYKSKIISSLPILLIEVSFISSPSNVLDVNTLLGSMILPLSKMLFAISNIDSSVSEFPTLRPEDFIKVFAIPPPTIIWSATSLICFIRSSFVETFAPPMIAI